MTLAALLVLAFTSLGAATVNGALGYGYSSISVPIALLVVAGRVLSPALVVIEVAINFYALYWNRRSVGKVMPRVWPLAIGLVPGVIGGALLLGHIAPSTIKLSAYVVLLPLVLIQASGLRWPLRNERRAAVPLGAGVGVLYGVTTISGPPLALFWNNQGLPKDEFKVALAVVRSIESAFALLGYAYLGLLTRESAELLPWIAPGVLIGFPLGHALVQRVSIETFRRVCMSFDAYLISFGLTFTLAGLGVPPGLAGLIMIATALVDARLLIAYFRSPTRRPLPAPAAEELGLVTASIAIVPRLSSAGAPPAAAATPKVRRAAQAWPS
ncbi:MAG TPA: sulfite exporter TauE/SafE family protein [Kofleriaceae bacterium]|nr:sulfite exporter TauE/SafE family protein [Kofleriaceae bacterium]